MATGSAPSRPAHQTYPAPALRSAIRANITLASGSCSFLLSLRAASPQNAKDTLSLRMVAGFKSNKGFKADTLNKWAKSWLGRADLSRRTTMRSDLRANAGRMKECVVKEGATADFSPLR